VQGRRCWFGVRPRRSGEWYALRAEWQSLLAGAPIGLLNAPAWVGDDGVRIEAGAAADAFYTVRRNWRENFRIVLATLRFRAWCALPRCVGATRCDRASPPPA
jgi:hypothetical protein